MLIFRIFHHKSFIHPSPLLIFTMKHQQAEGTYQCHRHTDKGRIMIAQSHRYRDSTKEGTQGIAQIKRCLDAASTQHLASFAVLHDEILLGRADAEKTGTGDKHHRSRYPAIVRQEEGGKQGGRRQELKITGEAARLEAVCQQSTHLVAHYHSQTGKNHQQRNTRCMESTVHLQEWRDVAEPTENAAIAQEGGGDDKSGSQMAHESELRLHTLIGQCLHIGHPLVNHIERDDAQHHRHHKRYSPRDGVT